MFSSNWDLFKIIIVTDKINSEKMLDDKLFALLTVLLSGLFSLLVVLITNWMTSRFENKKFNNQLKKEKIEAIRNLYENTIYMLQKFIVQSGKGSKEEQDEFNRIKARLALRSTKEIEEQYASCFDVAEDWARIYVKSLPEKTESGYSIIKSGMNQFAEQAKPLLDKFHNEFEKLKNLMIQDLSKIEKE